MRCLNKLIKLSVYIFIFTFSYISAFTSYYFLVNSGGKKILLLASLGEIQLQDIDRMHINQWQKLLEQLISSGSISNKASCIFEFEPQNLNMYKKTGCFPKGLILDPITASLINSAVKTDPTNSAIRFQANDPRGHDSHIIQGMLPAIARFIEKNDYSNPVVWQAYKERLLSINPNTLIQSFTLEKYFRSLNSYYALIEKYRNEWPIESTAYTLIDEIYDQYSSFIEKARLHFADQDYKTTLLVAICNLVENYRNEGNISNKIQEVKVDLCQNLDYLVFSASIVDNILKNQEQEASTIAITGEWAIKNILNILNKLGYNTIKQQSNIQQISQTVSIFNPSEDFLENLLKYTRDTLAESIIVEQNNSEILDNKIKCNSCGSLEQITKLKKCLGCNKVYYCNRECQNNDWPEHKNDCIRIDK